MAVIYVKEQGATIRKLGERIVVSKNSATLLDIPVFQMENLAVIGNVQLTSQALYLMMENGVDVSFFSFGGRYLGHAAAESSRNIFLRFEQYACYLDEKKRLAMAKCIVLNKIGNQIDMIRSHRWNEGEELPKQELERLETLCAQVESKTSINAVMGMEGICSNIYFGVFAKMLKCDFRFHGRNRRPPRDPVNVILSLAYTFLTKEVSSALDAESFEPYLGFLHSIRYGRKSLALDVVEEFRQPAVDRLVIFIFNKRILGKFDFEFEEEGA